MNTNKLYEDMSIEEQVIADAELAAYFAKERAKPQPKIVFLPSAIINMEDIFAPSDDINHPNYR